MSYSLKVYLIGIIVWGSFLSIIIEDKVIAGLNIIIMLLILILAEVSKLNHK